MIKRQLPKKMIPVEHLTEDVLVGAGGIDVTSPPSNIKTVYDMENLDLALDNSLTLRNPLLYKDSVAYENVPNAVEYIFDDSCLSILSKSIYISNELYHIVTDAGATVSDNDILVDTEAVKIINTNTSSIISGFKFNLNSPNLRTYSKEYYLTGENNNWRYRPIRITKENNSYKLELMHVETPIHYTDSNTNTTQIYFNLLNDYQYSIRDNYNAGYVYVNSIIAYTPNLEHPEFEGKSKEAILELIKGKSIEQLTESNMFILVDSITSNESDKIYILKAFVNNAINDDKNFQVYCTWEKTFDNVTWTALSKVVEDANHILLGIKDASTSYEKLDDSYEYTRHVYYIPFLDYNAGVSDAIEARPDVLVLDGIDSAKYRFTLRSIPIYTEVDSSDWTVTYSTTGINTEVSSGQKVVILNNAERSATIGITVTVTVPGNKEDMFTNLKLFFNAVYDTALRYPNYKASFTSITGVNDEISFSTAYDPTLKITTATATGNISITLSTLWTVQSLCIGAYIYNMASAEPTLLYKGIAVGTNEYPVYVGYNPTLINPNKNPNVFNYLINNVSILKNNSNITISNGHTDLYRDVYRLIGAPEKRVFDNDTYQEISEDVTLSGNGVNETRINNYLEICELISEAKSNIPLDYIRDLQEDNASYVPRLYNFNNIKYYLSNYTLSLDISITFSTWMDVWFYTYFGISPIYFAKLYGYYDFSIKVPLSISLYKLLTENLKNVLNEALINAAAYIDNISYTVTAQYGDDGIIYDKDIPEEYIPLGRRMYNTVIKGFIYHLCTNFLNDLNHDYDEMQIVSEQLRIYGAPFKDNSSEYLDINLNSGNISASSETITAYTYNPESSMWHKNDAIAGISIKRRESGEWVDLLTTNNTPESYNIGTVNSFSAVSGHPFDYLVSTGNDGIKIIREGAYSLRRTFITIRRKQTDYVMNVNEQLLLSPEIPENADIEDIANIDRYSLELSSYPYDMLYTTVKQVEKYDTVDVFHANVLYYNYRMWYFGQSLSNTIYFSNVDSLTVTLENSLTLSTDTDDYITSLVPWRDYLIATTKRNLFLISKLGDSYIFKKINTFIGVPESDSNTCKSILNGIIFKSSTKVFVAHPNNYSSDDTILNITDISKPISHHLIEGTNNFAIATEYEYFLFIPRDTDTLVFKYEYTRKVWSKFTYPVVFVKAKLLDVSNILVISNEGKIYYFNKTLEWYKAINNIDYLEYGDYLDNVINSETVSKIQFYVDTGQKSTDFQRIKQFTESKFILATTDVKDTFPIESAIYVDGINLVNSGVDLVKDMQVITNDVRTDSSFLKKPDTDIGYLNTNIINDSGDTFNTIRQKLVRYMGKGKTIRHILQGKSSFNFKIYMIYYRYRIPHGKQ